MHDVISAFLDNEPFDAQELSEALAAQEGRDLLIDLIALRSVIQPVESVPVGVTKRRPVWALASVAAVLLALIGGYQFGRSDVVVSSRTVAPMTRTTAPEPTTVLKFEPGVNWRETLNAGGR